MSDPRRVLTKLTIDQIADVISGGRSWRYDRGSWPCRCGGRLLVRDDWTARCDQSGCGRRATRWDAYAEAAGLADISRRLGLDEPTDDLEALTRRLGDLPCNSARPMVVDDPEVAVPRTDDVAAAIRKHVRDYWEGAA